MLRRSLLAAAVLGMTEIRHARAERIRIGAQQTPDGPGWYSTGSWIAYPPGARCWDMSASTAEDRITIRLHCTWRRAKEPFGRVRFGVEVYQEGTDEYLGECKGRRVVDRRRFNVTCVLPIADVNSAAPTDDERRVPR